MLEYLAPILGGALDFLGGQSTNSANRQIASENRRWQERMSNTAYQRANQDMRSAGLNPMLAYSKGGASSPSGTTIPMENPLKNAGNVGSQVAQNLLATKRLDAEIQNLNSSTALNVEKRNTEKTSQAAQVASASLTNASTALELQRPELLRQQINIAMSDADRAWINAVKANAELTQEQAKAAVAKIEKEITQSGVGEVLIWMERLGLSPEKVVDMIIGASGSIPKGLSGIVNALKSSESRSTNSAVSLPYKALDPNAVID